MYMLLRREDYLNVMVHSLLVVLVTFEFYNRSPRPCPGVKCYRTCRGHAQALHVMYMLLRREDYLNVMVHVCDSFLKDKRLHVHVVA